MRVVPFLQCILTRRRFARTGAQHASGCMSSRFLTPTGSVIFFVGKMANLKVIDLAKSADKAPHHPVHLAFLICSTDRHSPSS